MRMLGIDPGLTGALSLVDDVTGESDVIPMPTRVISSKMVKVKKGKKAGQKRLKETRIVDGKAVADWVEKKNPDRATCERVSSMPEQGVVSVFTFGRAFGAVVAAVEAMNVRVNYVGPAEWKRAAGLIGKNKAASLTLARKRYKQSANLLRRAKDDGLAEALLIAGYGVLRDSKRKTVH